MSPSEERYKEFVEELENSERGWPASDEQVEDV
jgi:hypothetical protein